MLIHYWHVTFMGIFKSSDDSILIILAILCSQAAPVFFENWNIQQKSHEHTPHSVVWMMIFEHISGKSVCYSKQL